MGKSAARLTKSKNGFFEVENQIDLSKELKKFHSAEEKHRVMMSFKNGGYIIFEFYSELAKDEFDLYISME